MTHLYAKLCNGTNPWLTCWYHLYHVFVWPSKVWDMASKHVLFQMDPVKVGMMFRVERLEVVFNTHEL